jgi:hypothetical protein
MVEQLVALRVDLRVDLLVELKGGKLVNLTADQLAGKRAAHWDAEMVASKDYSLVG